MLGVILTMRFDARLPKIDQKTTERFIPWWEERWALVVENAVRRRHGKDSTPDAATQLIEVIRKDALRLAMITRHKTVIRRMVRWTPYARRINEMSLGVYLEMQEKHVEYLRRRVADYGIPPEVLVHHFV